MVKYIEKELVLLIKVIKLNKNQFNVYEIIFARYGYRRS